MTTPIVQVRHLTKRFGDFVAVNDISFDIQPGEILGLLGPNGAGKTTSFRMTIGLIDADGGSVRFDGRDVTRLPMYLRARAGMGYLGAGTVADLRTKARFIQISTASVRENHPHDISITQEAPNYTAEHSPLDTA